MQREIDRCGVCQTSVTVEIALKQHGTLLPETSMKSFTSNTSEVEKHWNWV